MLAIGPLSAVPARLLTARHVLKDLTHLARTKTAPRVVFVRATCVYKFTFTFKQLGEFILLANLPTFTIYTTRRSVCVL